MGRKLMRVPLDFDWPMNKPWTGYINPFFKHCPHCIRGSTIDYRWLEEGVRLILLMGSEAKRTQGVEELHPYLTDIRNAPNGHPTSEMTKLTDALSGSTLGDGIFGFYDGLASYHMIKKLVKMAKLPKDWGVCPHCHGEDIDPVVMTQYKAWKETKPPRGKGYQLWDDTVEDCPVSPVFKTLDELCEWCEKNATTFAHFTATKEEWKQMLSEDFVHHRSGNAVFM